MTGTAPPTPLHAALGGLCPRCGARTLFAGFARFAERCSCCALDYRSFNVGDGPAAFLILIVGALAVGFAAWLQVAADPPWWLHLLLWPPFSIAAVLGGLRLAKGLLLTLEYQHAAREGRLRQEPKQ